MIEGFSSYFLHKSRSKTASADFDFFGRTFDQSSNGPKVRAKHALGAVIGVTDIITD